MAELSVNIGNLQLKNPVMTASGTFGYGIEYADFIDISRLGGIFVKGTTIQPREGNPYPRQECLMQSGYKIRVLNILRIIFIQKSRILIRI